MSLPQSWVLEIDPSVFKILKKLPRKDSERLWFAIYSLSHNYFEGDIQKMKGEQNIWRRRVGSYRIFYELLSSAGAISVFHIERRNSHTY